MEQQILNTPSVHAGHLYLARMFCRLVKEASDLATALRNGNPQVGDPGFRQGFEALPLKGYDRGLKPSPIEGLRQGFEWNGQPR